MPPAATGENGSFSHRPQHLVHFDPIECSHETDADFVLGIPTFTFYQEFDVRFPSANSDDISSTVSGLFRKFNVIAESFPKFRNEFFKLSVCKVQKRVGAIDRIV